MKSHQTGLVILFFLLTAMVAGQDKIDRRAVVERHNIKSSDLHLQLPLGNGNFCVTVDGTGLQTFGGNIMSHDAWHSSPLPKGFKPEDVPVTGTFQKGRSTGYKGDIALPEGFTPLRNWMRRNAHIANLGRIRLMRPGGVEVKPEEITDLKRELVLWAPRHVSHFKIDGVDVSVYMMVTKDNELYIHCHSTLFQSQKLEVILDFPYPTEQNGKWVGDFNAPQRHSTKAETTNGFTVLTRQADTLVYPCVVSTSDGGPRSAYSLNLENHSITFTSQDKSGSSRDGEYLDCVQIMIAFRKPKPDGFDAFFHSMGMRQKLHLGKTKLWSDFWQSGAFVDLSESTDPRWRELERRIVLSQYLMRCNTAGSWPSSESGLLTCDPWHGRFHMEMVWWHLAHYALWDRLELSDEALKCYEKHKFMAKRLAEQLGYKGYKWGKSVEPGGRTSPWVGNQVLLWKQPHPIFFAELEYRNRPTKETLEKWADILDGTAEHMVDYVTKDADGVYHLDPAMPPSEVGISKDTVFDLAYWRWGLDTANRWRERMGKPRNEFWDEVRKNLAPLPTVDDPQDGKIYARSPEWLEEFTKRNWEHPDMAGVYGMLPAVNGVDPTISKRTVDKMRRQWNWSKCWGWDFPWMAMSCVRNGEPGWALDMLLHDSSRNRYDERGVNLGGPCPYLPGNGGLLYVVGMMCAGWDGGPKPNKSGAVGFPSDGWKVKHEGFKAAP